jgi:eukaryotic-like serine/threonine-protein kinase
MEEILWRAAFFAMGAVALVPFARRHFARREKASIKEQLVGPYRLLDRIGSGGMGRVHLAEHRAQGRRCAVKLIHAEHLYDAALVTRFEREVQSLAALSHPNVVRVQDHGRAADGTLWYAMELVEGKTLEELVQLQGPIDLTRAVRILRQLCDALLEAHWRGLVHRDLKPGNVILRERSLAPDHVVLLDFGLVGAMERGPTHTSLTRADMIMGTPGFMAPEQSGGEGKVTTATDIYSLGAIGYFLLTGHAPFTGSILEIVASQFTEEPKAVVDVRRDVPRELSDVIARCLRMEAADRFSDAHALDRALAISVPSSADAAP